MCKAKKKKGFLEEKKKSSNHTRAKNTLTDILKMSNFGSSKKKDQSSSLNYFSYSINHYFSVPYFFLSQNFFFGRWNAVPYMELHHFYVDVFLACLFTQVEQRRRSKKLKANYGPSTFFGHFCEICRSA